MYVHVTSLKESTEIVGGVVDMIYVRIFVPFLEFCINLLLQFCVSFSFLTLFFFFFFLKDLNHGYIWCLFWLHEASYYIHTTVTYHRHVNNPLQIAKLSIPLYKYAQNKH